MEKWLKSVDDKIEEFEIESLIEDINDVLINDTSFGEAALGTHATRAGIQMQSLQSVIDSFASLMNNSAIAKSTGLPVRTPVAQYKGFAAEEYYKLTLKINALAEGVPDWKIGVYTKGTMPDGTNLSGIDMETDISVWTRKHAWSKPKKNVDYQSKIHNEASKYAIDMGNPQYEGVEFVGGAGQGVNDKIKVKVDGKEVMSDSITSEAAEKLAEDMKAQVAPKYQRSAEKKRQLDRINMRHAVITGAIAGTIFSAIEEICYVLKNKSNLDEEQFIKSITHVLCGTAEGGVRGGTIMASVQAMGKVLGKEIPTNTLGAVPVMAVANTAVDFAKDLYKCFIKESIDTDDLLCNSVNNAFSSVASFGGTWAIGKLGGQIAGQFGSQAFTNAVGAVTSAKTAAATGASIGSSLGPIGTLVGATVGGIVIGLGANAIIGIANKDAGKAFNECIKEITSHIEMEGCEKLYYFADSMSGLSDFRLSFKDFLPCYNLISDLKEYNLRKKAIKQIRIQLDNGLEELDLAKKNAIREIEKQQKEKIEALQMWFDNQRIVMYDAFGDSVNTYVSNSYYQYLSLYDVISGNAQSIKEGLQQRIVVHNSILDCTKNRIEFNKELNILLDELLSDEDMLKPIIDKVKWCMQQDEIVVGKQYLSYEEALALVSEVN